MLGQKWLKFKARPSARSRCTNPFCLLTWLGKCQFDLLGSKASSPNFFRDAGNVGPSVGRALGNFDGGRCLKKSCIITQVGNSSTSSIWTNLLPTCSANIATGTRYVYVDRVLHDTIATNSARFPFRENIGACCDFECDRAV